MNNRKYEFIFIAEVIVGIVLIALSALEIIDPWCKKRRQACL